MPSTTSISVPISTSSFQSGSCKHKLAGFTLPLGVVHDRLHQSYPICSVLCIPTRSQISPNHVLSLRLCPLCYPSLPRMPYATHARPMQAFVGISWRTFDLLIAPFLSKGDPAFLMKRKTILRQQLKCSKLIKLVKRIDVQELSWSYNN